MRRWSSTGGPRVWTYRTLVPTDKYPLWEERVTAGTAMHRDLYTSVADERESDRVERWLNHEVETPGFLVLDKLSAGEQLNAIDRRRLARFIAALECRTPREYLRFTQQMQRMLPTALETVAKDVERQLKEAVASGTEMSPTEPPDRVHSIAVRLTPGSGSDSAAVDIGATVGREFWLDQIEFVVNDVSRILEHHDWTLIRPCAGESWLTSDQPVVRLRFDRDDRYDFEGRWGDVGTEVLLPISPVHLLYTQVGIQYKHCDSFSSVQTQWLQRFTAEHAYRWIIAREPADLVRRYRPRDVDLHRFAREENEWKAFHDEQTRAALFPGESIWGTGDGLGPDTNRE